MAKRSRLEESLALQLRVVKAPRPEREYRFAAEHVGHGPGIRKRLQLVGLKDWRFDFAWPDIKFAVEVDGGAFGGRHTTGVGFTGDLLKQHHAFMHGWHLYRCGAELIDSGQAVKAIELYLKK